ncbi:hypothetical protein L6452_40175 [Arctium lappa]|uniref:Uncharacterized protein n=1 Tax=Arctium lappa TaxID=4217 RepID=A0ACB8XMY3_ARCLA|nr:hypothetical protein L6452_40175 [Arctium lappa]
MEEKHTVIAEVTVKEDAFNQRRVRLRKDKAIALESKEDTKNQADMEGKNIKRKEHVNEVKEETEEKRKTNISQSSGSNNKHPKSANL